MAYSTVLRRKSGRAVLLYAVGDGTGHNKRERRNEVVSVVNMLPGIDIADQMDVYWRHAREGHTTQVLHVIQSFSKSEFNPENPEDLEKANVVGYEFAKRYYPNRQVAIFTQVDGKGGYVHNHVVINDVEMETYRGCEREQYHGKHVMRWTDEVAKEFTDLDTGKGEEKATRTEQVKREKGDYVWKDDLRERIRQSLRESSNSNEFSDRLRANGVDFVLKTSKKYGVYYTYELVDFSNRPEGEKVEKNYKARSYKLGGIYSYEGIEEYFQKMRSVEHEEYLERKLIGKKYKPKMTFREYLREHEYEYETDELGNISSISADYQGVVQEYEEYLMSDFEEIDDEELEGFKEELTEEVSDTQEKTEEDTVEISDTDFEETREEKSEDEEEISAEPEVDSGSSSEEIQTGFIEEPEEIIEEPTASSVPRRPRVSAENGNSLDETISYLAYQNERKRQGEQKHRGQTSSGYAVHRKSRDVDGIGDDVEGLVADDPIQDGKMAETLALKEMRDRDERRRAVFAEDGAKAAAIMEGLNKRSGSSSGDGEKPHPARIYGKKPKKGTESGGLPGRIHGSGKSGDKNRGGSTRIRGTQGGKGKSSSRGKDRQMGD